MNVMLFLPFGMTLPFALPNGFKNKVTITVGSAAVISIVVEFIQFCFGLGLCETDDVIMNTLGAAIGTVSYVYSAVHIDGKSMMGKLCSVMNEKVRCIIIKMKEDGKLK
jgi:glycopeptide antibiotics resistance protein